MRIYTVSDYGHYDSGPSDTHAGKGPKTYPRFDQKIYEDVCDALAEDSWIDAGEIEVSVHDGIVRLSGFVPERRMKRLAEDCAEKINGVLDIQNDILTHSRFKETH